MTTKPEPLTPAEADLREFTFMPLDVVRFAQSDLVAFEDPEAVVAAILLWGASWHQVPAGSLTNDERTLSRLAGYRRPGEDWDRVKAGAMRGWIECSDGRLYHPVVAEKVRESWESRLKARHRAYCSAIRQHNGRYPDDKRESPSFEDWRDTGQPREVRRASAARQEDLPLSRVTEPNVTRDKGPSHANIERQGTGTVKGQGQGQGESIDSDDDVREDLTTLLAEAARIGAVAVSPAYQDKFGRELAIIAELRREGITRETILDTIAKTLDSTNETSIGSLKFYAGAIRKAHARTLPRGASTAKAEPLAPMRTRDADDPRVGTFRDRLKAEVGAPGYAAWLAPQKTAVAPNGVGIVVTARSEFIAARLREQYLDVLSQIASTSFGSDRVKVAAE